jgi:hypothetical protein
MSDPNAQDPPLPEGDPANNFVGTPPVAPQGGNIVRASTSQEKHMDMVKIPPIVRMKNLMMQGPTSPLDDHNHQGTIFKPLSITLIYPLTIHRVLATLERYPNLMEPAIPSGRTRWRSI